MAGDFRGKKALTGNDDYEFQEEEMWNFTKKGEMAAREFSPFTSAASFRTPHAARKGQSGSSETPKKLFPLSTPVNIRDFPKTYRQTPDYHDKEMNLENDYPFGGENDEEDGDGEMLPPHEIIARRMSRSSIASYSMCEGVGRTLKGRDLSRVRNAVLTKTGFLD